MPPKLMNCTGTYVSWRVNQWKSVLFNVESKFCLQTGSKRFLTRVASMKETDFAGPKYVCVSLSRGIVNVQLHRDGIFNPIVRPYAGAVSDSFIVQDNNDRQHRARLVENYLREQIMVWVCRQVLWT
ncbi:hypothetical protein AVEN_188590-1 [Araneus ventricosus]|uniref:Tc1-like transposase DDE domain-containing protein n=1 Tax=Araneus ventricosus TaxID=182803 RepID=A0A4Y2HRF5_ARAVE|nr:hypothetical protein AVEN_188590-1 [Araneus ventricosus]